MRHKIVIQEKIATHTDSFGAVHYGWRDLCRAWAEFGDVDGDVTIKFRNDVRRGMRVILNSTIFTIGRVEEFNDGGIHLLRIFFDSARGVYTRARTVPEATALPSAQNEAGEKKGLLP